MSTKSRILPLVEGAMLIAVATVLSMVKLIDLPYGGSVTACSALPVLLIGYRHGTRFGLFAAVVYALLQLLLGMSTLSFFTTPLSIVAVILLDYILAFAVLGLGGLFRRQGRSQGQALVSAALLMCVLRYLCHVISGCTVWAGLSIPTEAALVYSLAYNATYMIPETVVTALGAWYLSCSLDIGGQRLSRAKASASAPVSMATLCGLGVWVATVVADIVMVFRHLQDAESGNFAITRLTLVNWPIVGGVTVLGGLVGGLLCLLARRSPRTSA